MDSPTPSRPPAKEIVLTPVDAAGETDAALEAEIFWEENKSKIFTAIAAILIAAIGWGVWNLLETRASNEQAAALDAARTEPALREVINKYPGSVVAGNAQLLLASQLRTAGKNDEALALLSDFTAKQTGHPLLADAWMSYATTLEAKGDNAKAAETYASVAATHAESQAAPAALAAQARLARTGGDSKKARAILENLVQRFPASFWSQQAQQEIDRLPKE